MMANMRLLALVVVALVLAACLNGRARLPQLADTTLARADGGTLIVTERKGVAIDGWRRRLVEAAWSRYCHFNTAYACDPKESYQVQIGDDLKRCWADVSGVMIETTAAGPQRTGIQTQLTCFPKGDDFVFLFWPCPPMAYRPGESPGIPICENRPRAISDAPVAVQVFERSTKRK